jgi:hypothetical protein
MFLPPNMTHILQPMDLVVNSVVKSAMRRHRILLLMSYFREYRARYYMAKRSAPPLPYPDFDPPPPSIIDGLNGMYEMRERSLLHERFRESVKRFFQSVGLAPITTESDPIGTFVTYRDSNTPGTIRRSHFGSDGISATEDILTTVPKKLKPLVA